MTTPPPVPSRTHSPSHSGEAGFSLLETLIAMGILAGGLLSLAGVFAMGLNHLAGSSAALTAREKAREAVESVHTARDTRVIKWCQIRNVGSSTDCATGEPGVFLDGAQPLRTAGTDGIVNTADDGDVEVSLAPGPDNILGTEDDLETPLTMFHRRIEITDLMKDGHLNPNLRQLRVTITYQVGQTERTYTLTTYISSIS